MITKKRWLEPNLMSDEDKATIARLAKERHMTIQDVVDLLEAEQEKLSRPQPPAVKHNSVRPEFESRPLDPEPHGTPLGYELDDTRRVEDAPAQRDQPDPRLVEIARLWSRLNERDREEILLTARMKVFLNNKAAGQ